MFEDTWQHVPEVRTGPEIFVKQSLEKRNDGAQQTGKKGWDVKSNLSDGLGENLLESDTRGASSLQSMGRNLDCQSAWLRCYTWRIN